MDRPTAALLVRNRAGQRHWHLQLHPGRSRVLNLPGAEVVRQTKQPDAGFTPGVRPPPKLLILNFEKGEFYNVKQALCNCSWTRSRAGRFGRVFNSSR